MYLRLLTLSSNHIQMSYQYWFQLSLDFSFHTSWKFERLFIILILFIWNRLTEPLCYVGMSFGIWQLISSLKDCTYDGKYMLIPQSLPDTHQYPNTDQYRSLLINVDQFWSIPIIANRCWLMPDQGNEQHWEEFLINVNAWFLISIDRH